MKELKSFFPFHEIALSKLGYRSTLSEIDVISLSGD